MAIARAAGRPPRRAARRAARAASSTTWPRARPRPEGVLRAAQAYAEQPDAQRLMRTDAGRRAAAPGVAAPAQPHAGRHRARIVRLRRALLQRLPRQPELAAARGRPAAPAVSSWFNPGFLQMRRVDWNSPAQAAGEDHPPRGGARDRRLGRPAPPPAARPALLRLLPPAAARRAADLRRGGAAARDARGDRAADRQGQHAAAARAVHASRRSTGSATASPGCAACRSATS